MATSEKLSGAKQEQLIKIKRKGRGGPDPGSVALAHGRVNPSVPRCPRLSRGDNSSLYFFLWFVTYSSKKS